MADQSSPVEVAQQWLDSHRTSRNTWRTYDAQLQQLCEWAFLKESDLVKLTAAQVEQYLVDLARGQATLSVRNPGVQRSESTLLVARSALRSLFDALMRAGVRPDNPARWAVLPRTERRTDGPKDQGPADNAVRWLDVRQTVIHHAGANCTGRHPLYRAIAIAELASWSGLRRSELAGGTMGDFVSLHHRWWIRVRRFGSGDEELVEVAKPAMDAVRAYRTSRGLPNLPVAGEKNVPLISRAGAEHPVNAWTVAHSLGDLLLKGLVPVNAKAPAIVVLRRAVATEALKAKIAAHQLARHLRSRRLVDQVAAQLHDEPIGDALRLLAA